MYSLQRRPRTTRAGLQLSRSLALILFGAASCCPVVVLGQASPAGGPSTARGSDGDRAEGDDGSPETAADAPASSSDDSASGVSSDTRSTDRPRTADPAVERVHRLREARDTTALTAILGRGGPDAEIHAAIDALGELGDPSALDALTPYTRHRRVAARRRAYMAIARIGRHTEDASPRRAVVAVLRRGLRDVEAPVRDACARAFVHLPPEIAQPAVEDLFTALGLGVHGAAASLGAIAPTSALARYDGHLGRLPIGTMLEGYTRFVRRHDIPVEAKRAIGQRLEEVAGLSVRAFFVAWRRDMGDETPQALRAQVERSIRRIPTANDPRLRRRPAP